MGENNTQWTIQSNATMTRLMAALGAALGSLVAFIAWHRIGPLSHASGDTVAMLLCGLFFLLAGIWALMITEDVAITVDLAEHMLLILRTSSLGRSRAKVRFSEIERISIQVGDGEGFLYYNLMIHPRMGKRISTGRWSYNRAQIFALGERLAHDVGCPIDRQPSFFSITANQAILSVSCGLVVYALWYRLHVGPLGPAMLHGASPIVITLLGSLIACAVLKWLQR